MAGFLIPSSGGKAQPLSRSRMYLGRKCGDRTKSLNRDTAFCQLEFIDGWWYIEDLGSPGGLQINFRPCKRERLSPNDEFAIGKYRFRIQYESPVYGDQRADRSRRDVGISRSTHKQNSNAGRGSLGRLVPCGGGKSYAISKASVVVGRRHPCDVQLPFSTVSGRHCRLDLNAGYWHVTDLESHNGTWKNGLKCDRAWIYPQDRLSLATNHFSLDYIPYGKPPDEDFVPLSREIDNSPLLSKVGITEDDIEELLTDADEKDDRQQRIDLEDEV